MKHPFRPAPDSLIAKSKGSRYNIRDREFGLTPAARTRISAESTLVRQGIINPEQEKFFRR
jgi:hypothetical protein